MNRRSSLLITVSVLVMLFGTFAFAQSTSQSLGDYARAIRKSKNDPAAPSTPSVYDNDNLPKASSISVVGDADGSAASQPVDEASNKEKDKEAAPQDGAKDPVAKDSKDDKAQDQTKDKDKDETPQIKPGQSAEERQKAYDAWKDKLAAQQKKIEQMSHELDLLQREYRVKAAEFYADTARRTQNPTGFAQEDADYKKQIADKQQAIDDAKAKLAEMQEDARKAGAPSSVTE